MTDENHVCDVVSVKDFGAVGDYVTDDTASIMQADLYCSTYGKTLDFGDGVYRCTNGILRKARWKGNFAPTLGTFPLTADDKIFLRPGYKAKLPGASLIFSGTGTAIATTERTDRFSSFTYCLMDDPSAGTPHIEGIAVVMDMDFRSAGGALTSVGGDNRSNYDVGYYATTGWTSHKNFVVFGYFPKAGTLIYGADIDYNTFDESCSTSGDIGLAICGNGKTGLSGTRYSGSLYANDHHSRSIVDNQWGTTTLYIDGDIPTASAPQNSLGGHYFSGSMRTYCDNPFILDHANSIVFDGMVFEWPNKSGSVGATKASPVGTTNTYGVVIQNCRHLSPFGVDGIYQFANSIAGVFIHSDPRQGSIGLSYGGVGAFLRSNGGNPALQLSGDINGSTKGWTVLQNQSSANRLEARFENAQAMTLTPLGALTANRLIAVATGSSSAEDPSVRLSGSDPATGFYRPAANNIAISVAGTKVWDIQTDGFLRPGKDNAFQIGTSSFRAKEIFAANNIINTSDEVLKTKRVLDSELLGEQSYFTKRELAAWGDVRHSIFRWNDSIEKKGMNDARLNVGFMAQEIRDVFAAHGLNVSQYALWCEDPIRTLVTRKRKASRQKIELVPHKTRTVEIVDGKPVLKCHERFVETPCVEMIEVVDEDGLMVLDASGKPELYPVPVMEEFEEEYEAFESHGTRLGLRYEQCLIFETAFLRSLLIDQEQRIRALEDTISQ
ncbi:tail fiber domain-containing protein [Pseudomonas sp. zjy_8]|uniref:tail fiber domain-containing protein n=1 Tax=Pseudomonas sp. GLN_2 TaxID=3367180 RepID=UPI00370C1AD0